MTRNIKLVLMGLFATLLLSACNEQAELSQVDEAEDLSTQAVNGTLLLGGSGFKSGVSNWSWNTSLQFGQEVDGKSAVNVKYDAAWAGLSLKLGKSTQTSEYAGVAVTLKGSGQKLALYLNDADSSKASLSAGSSLKTVEIPWSKLGSPGKVERVTLQSSSGNAQAGFFIDNLYLYKDAGTAPTAPSEPVEPKPAPAPTQPSPTPTTGNYRENLELIKAASVRNRNHDDSPYIDTAQADLPLDPATSPLFGSRQEYVDKINPGPIRSVAGNFRVACEFSHFSYDDPLVHPNQPGAAHLHMYFGNTDVNAYSTYDTLKDSGSSTCNGQELNRTGYWVPALFDTQGDVRIPFRIEVYYKGYNTHNGPSEVYPPGAATIAIGDKQAHNVSSNQGGTLGMGGESVNFICSDASNAVYDPVSNTIPDCANSPVNNGYRLLKMRVKFPICWNREDPSNPDNWFLPETSDWYWGDCGERAYMPHLEYIIFYRVGLDESTAGWYLSSDVDPHTREVSSNPGASTHGDWWGGWHPDINQQWIDNCVNDTRDQLRDCSYGYLSDQGSDPRNPNPGPALKFRPYYDGPDKVSAETLYRDLCPQGGELASTATAAYCVPPQHMQH